MRDPLGCWLFCWLFLLALKIYQNQEDFLSIIRTFNRKSVGYYLLDGRWVIIIMRWVAILVLVVPAIGLAKIEPEFYLCSSYVEKSTVGKQTDSGWPVYVRLTEVGTTSLEAFTEANTGKMIRILVGSREFLRATIWIPIPGGNLHGTFSSQEVATDWQRILTGKLPAAPSIPRR
jgi:hypothetical protein